MKTLPFGSYGLSLSYRRPRSCRVFHTSLQRHFSSSGISTSGHNRWSKIKHDKAKIDASLTRQRAGIVASIQHACNMQGPDVNFNPQLAHVLAHAKKLGVPKPLIEAAIARSQGKSVTGAKLERLNIEAMLPGSVAVIIECQTDSRVRTLADVRHAIKKLDGATTGTQHLFTRRGKVVLINDRGLSEEDMLETVATHGGLDLTMHGTSELRDVGQSEVVEVVIWTQANDTKRVVDGMKNDLGMITRSSEIVWVAKQEALVDGDEEAVDTLRAEADVMAVHSNLRCG